jgi:hypothetical protein
VQKLLEFKPYNFVVLNLNFLFKDVIETGLIDDLHKYNLLSDRLNSSARKLFYHHVFHGVCEVLLKEKYSEKVVLFFSSSHIPDSCQILKYYDEKALLLLLNAIVLKIKKLLPVRVFVASYTIDFIAHLIKTRDGRGIEIVSNLKACVENITFERYTFNKIQKFAKQNELIFLSEKYFNQLKTKQLILV